MAFFDNNLKITKDFVEKSSSIFVMPTDFFTNILDNQYSFLNIHPRCMPLPCLKISREHFDPNKEEDASMLNVFISSLAYQIKNKPNTHYYIKNFSNLNINDYAIVPWIKNRIESELKDFNNVTFLWAETND